MYGCATVNVSCCCETLVARYEDSWRPSGRGTPAFVSVTTRLVKTQQAEMIRLCPLVSNKTCG
jgi:hypothetical protein